MDESQMCHSVWKYSDSQVYIHYDSIDTTLWRSNRKRQFCQRLVVEVDYHMAWEKIWSNGTVL